MSWSCTISFFVHHPTILVDNSWYPCLPQCFVIFCSDSVNVRLEQIIFGSENSREEEEITVQRCAVACRHVGEQLLRANVRGRSLILSASVLRSATARIVFLSSVPSYLISFSPCLSLLFSPLFVFSSLPTPSYLLAHLITILFGKSWNYSRKYSLCLDNPLNQFLVPYKNIYGFFVIMLCTILYLYCYIRFPNLSK